MRIAVILPVEERFDPVEGGAIARWVARVYEHVPFEATVFAPRPREGEGYGQPLWSSRASRTADRAITRLATVLSRLSRRNPVAVRGRLFAHGRLWLRLMRRELARYDLVHVHNRPLYAKWLRDGGYRGRIVLHMHNLLDIGRGDHTAEAVRCADLVLFCSHSLRDHAARTYPADIPPLSVVYNGVEVSEPPVPVEARERALLVTAGRLVPEKGALEAIAVTRELHRRGFPVQLRICGSFHFGSSYRSPFVRAVEAAAAEACREAGYDIVRLDGQLPHGELVALMGQARVFLYPCQWDEPFGMVLVEAMSAGAPPVSSLRGGIPEVLGPELSSRLGLPSDDLEAFADATQSLIENEAAWQETSARCYDRSTSFTWPAIARSFRSSISMFEEVPVC